jgi:hypothetical protein
LCFVSLLRFCVPPDTTTNSPENFSGDLAESCRAVGEGVLLEMGEEWRVSVAVSLNL